MLEELNQLVFFGYGKQIMSGVWLTVTLTLMTVLGSMVLGMLAALCKLSHNVFLRGLATIYTTAIRSVPDLVLLLLIFYNLQEIINWVCNLIGVEEYELDALASGIVTLSFIYGAFMTETFRGAILAIPKGQIEAGQACGMSAWHIFRYILLPQLIRYALPGVGNNLQVILKATAVVSLIGLEDIVRVTQYASGPTQKLLYFSLMAGVIYLLISVLATLILNKMHQIFSVGTKQVKL